jgi:hypothetical protein
LGTYFEMGGTLFVQSRIVRVETGEILAAHALQDEPSDFLVLQQALSTAWKGTLDHLVGAAPSPAPTRGAAPVASETAIAMPDVQAIDAALAYSEGLIYLDSRDVPRAREAFEKAVAADPRLEGAKVHLASLDL